METREQTVAKIMFFMDKLPDSCLRMAAGFMRGLLKSEQAKKQMGGNARHN